MKERPECGRMWLEDHLITPIQRIMRYNLLIEQLWHKTDPDHSDYEGLGRVRVGAWRGVV